MSREETLSLIEDIKIAIHICVKPNRYRRLYPGSKTTVEEAVDWFEQQKHLVK